jgi:hypothetical protein
MSNFNYFNKVHVSTTNFSDRQVTWTFNSAGILLLNESTVAGRVLEYSFNGTDVHGDLDPTLPSAGIAFDNRHESRVYLRLKTAGASVICRIEAWA